jgi:hypothetical protein
MVIPCRKEGTPKNQISLRFEVEAEMRTRDGQSLSLSLSLNLHKHPNAMKTLYFLIIALLSVSALTPQAFGQYKKPYRLFEKGEADIFAGFGLLPTFLKDEITQELPSFTLRFEQRLARNYSLGIETAHSVTTSKKADPFTDERQYRNRFYFLALRNSVHCNCETSDNWDVYGGFSVGLNLTRVSVVNGEFGEFEKLHGIEPRNTQMTFHGFLGARYACSPLLSFFGEIGYGISIIQAGVGVRLW